MKNILLIGFMGTGKSTVGRMLARALNRRFVDTDTLVERIAGMAIPEIFSRMGEPAFRELEARAVRTAAELRDVVIAVGGGAVQNPQTREVVKKHCTVAFLAARPETILARVENGERPMLSGYPQPEEKLARVIDLLNQRTPAYLETADMTVDTEPGLDFVVSEIMSKLAQESPAQAPTAVKAAGVDTPSGRYSIRIGSGLIASPSRLIAESCVDSRRVFVVSNPLVSELWLNDVETDLRDSGYTVETALIGDGEVHKSIQSAHRLYDLLDESGHDRSTVVLALGGGVVGDLAGFVAATFMRGLRFIQMPTTLLAQVDSSIGGKVAVNYRHHKNLIGAFHQPKLVLSDIRTLWTLSDRVFSEGMAEVIKTAILRGEGLFSFIERNAGEIAARNLTVLQEVVTACAELKARLVSKDERDEGQRMLLNLGHTFAHAFESACGCEGISHGQAVAVGICMATNISSRIGLARPGLADRISSLVHHFGLPTSISDLPTRPEPQQVLGHLNSDKKRYLGELRLVLPVDLGHVELVKGVPTGLIEETIPA
ncbi:MAG: 3-dehydroquinate synthase [Firmicutes bacterium]|nr:3-dehydroquinate synthase [Bacillota bacterium]